MIRCAIYTRKSSEEGLGQDFNSLDAQREACAAFIASQKHEGWQALDDLYEDGGYSGATLQRPGLQKLLADCREGNVDTIVVYKIDRLTRALSDFAKMVDLFDAHKVTFVSVTQQFNTTTSMGRLTLNVLLSFAQFEREVTGERIRDKIAASKAKGMWMGGFVPLGYDKNGRTLIPNQEEATRVETIFRRYQELKSIQALRDELDQSNIRSKSGTRFSIGQLAHILTNPIYRGLIHHKGNLYQGAHPAIIDPDLWDNVQNLRKAAKESKRHRTRAKERSLLAGLLWNAEGHPMSPSHSNKKGKRYRYYLSQAIIQGKSTQPDTITKIPAPELEGLLLKAIPKLLEDDSYLSTIFRSLTAAHRQQAPAVAQSLAALPSNQQHVVFRKLLIRAILSKDAVTCTFSVKAFSAFLGVELNTQDEANFTIPIRLKQIQGGATYILSNHVHQRPPNPTLIKAIAKAIRWNEMLVTGEIASQESLAKLEGVRGGYLRKIVRLAILAPDIVEAILNGEEPAGLTLAKLHTIKTADWPTQRRQLGF